MTQKEIKQLQKINNELWDKIREFTNQNERDLISEYVDNELLLEKECNQ